MVEEPDSEEEENEETPQGKIHGDREEEKHGEKQQPSSEKGHRLVTKESGKSMVLNSAQWHVIVVEDAALHSTVRKDCQHPRFKHDSK